MGEFDRYFLETILHGDSAQVGVEKRGLVRRIAIVAKRGEMLPQQQRPEAHDAALIGRRYDEPPAGPGDAQL